MTPQSIPTPHPAAYRPLWTASQRRTVRGVLMVERAARAASTAEAAALLAHRAANTRRALNADAGAVWLSHAARHQHGNPAALAVIAAALDTIEAAEDERRALRNRTGYGPERAPWRHFHELHPASVAGRANASWAPDRLAGEPEPLRKPAASFSSSPLRKAAGLAPRARRVR